MIYILEDDRKSVSGNTSLFITFAYNQNIISVIKEEPSYVYHKDSQLWEVPISSLASLLDKLVYFDDVQLIVKEDDKKEVNNVEIHTKFKTTPRDYQLDAIKFGLSHDKFMLLDEPGLGKTVEIMYIAEELKEKENLEHCLVICGLASLRTNWIKEIEKHSRLKGMMLGARVNRNGRLVWDAISKRVEQLSRPIDEFFIVTNIETLRDERIIDIINKGPNKIGMIVLDEGHCCVDGDTIISTSVGELSIKEIVTKKLKCKVKSYNFKRKNYEFKEIVSHISNECNEEKLLELSILNDSGNEVKLKCLESHKIFTRNRGWVCAKNLTCDDDVVMGEIYEGK